MWAATFLLDFNFRGSDDGGVLFGQEGREVDLGGGPSFVATGPAGGRLGGHVADELDEIGIGGRRFGEGTLDTVDHGLEGDITGDGIAALVVEFADGGADLVVGVRGDRGCWLLP